MTHGRPTLEDLAALASGELAGAEAGTLDSAIRAHPDLAGLLDRLRLIVRTLRSDDGVSPPASAVARAKDALARLAVLGTEGRGGAQWWQGLLDAVARLVFDSADPVLAAGFRAEGEFSGTRQLSFERDGMELDLQMEPGTFGGGSARCQVMGQVADPEGLVKVAGMPVAIVSTSDGGVVETATDATGMFVLTVEPGEYDVVIGGGRPMAIRGVRMP